MKNYSEEEIASESTRFFKDRYLANVLLKFADLIIVFEALLINIIFTEGGW
jgi:hypothetical protein